MTEAEGSRNEPASCRINGEPRWFVMTPLEPGLFLKEEVRVDFTPQLNRETGVLEYIEPELNLDGKAHTPCFVLGLDKEEYAAADMELLDAHFARIREQLGSEGPMFMPKPSRNHSRCHVCKTHFQDYLDVKAQVTQHISHPSHKRKLGQSAYNRQIADMCRWAHEELNDEDGPEVAKSPVVEKQKEEGSLKRSREYSFAEPKPSKKCKLASDSRLDETPEQTQTAGRDEAEQSPVLAKAGRFVPEFPSFHFQFPN